MDLPLPEETARRREPVIQFGGDDPLLLDHMSGLRADIRTLNLPLNEPETTELPIRHLAVTQLLHRFEFLYRVIFGSQIAAVDKMNRYGPQEPKEISLFFERARRRSPLFYGETNFDQWIGFLMTRNVVVLENNCYAINLYGREFLGFITRQGLPRKAH